MADVWSYVAHKDGLFAGAISGTLDHCYPNGKTPAGEAKKWKKEIAKFCGDFIADGFTITPTYSQEENSALIDSLGVWRSKKKGPDPDDVQQDLFSERQRRS